MSAARGRTRAVVLGLAAPVGAEVLGEHRCEVRGPLPGSPYDLSDKDLAWELTVDDEAAAVAALDAAARGVDLVLRIDLPPDVRATFLDDLGRVAHVRHTTGSKGPDPSAALSSEQRALLRQLSHGDTLDGAARRVGLSLRTATRRVAAARAALGVATTTEAVLALQRADDLDGV
jgi:hypothetical protein